MKRIGLILSLIVILAGIGFAGWYSQARESKFKKTFSQQTANDTYAGWQTYNEQQLSFKYPSSWKIVRTNSVPYFYIDLEGPEEPKIKLENINSSSEHSQKKRLGMTIGAKSFDTCKNPCQVYRVIPINSINAPNAKIVISDWDNQGYPQMIQIVDDPSVEVGSKIYKLGSLINGKHEYIHADVMYEDQASLGWIKDIDSLVQVQSFKDLINIIKSVEVK